MAVDGPGIVESDLAHDVYNEILDLYDEGLEPSAIRQRISSYELELTDDMEKEIYLAASAKAFWEIGHLDPALAAQLTELIDSGTSLLAWANPSESLASQRKAVLVRFLRQIASPRKNPRTRRKYSQVKTKLFSIGDCLSLAAADKTHRGVVCKILEHRGRCEYAILVMQPGTESTVESFISGYYFGRRIPHHASDPAQSHLVFGPHVIRPEHRMLVRSGNPFTVVGNVDLDPDKFMLGSFGGVLEMRHVIEDFVRTETNDPRLGMELLPLHDLLRHRR